MQLRNGYADNALKKRLGNILVKKMRPNNGNFANTVPDKAVAKKQIT